MDMYDRDGAPLTLDGYASLMGDPSYRRVASTVVPETGLWVSTVWLGLDHGWFGPPPIIFETLVFGTPDGDEVMERYATEAEALAGHVEVVRRMLGPRARYLDLSRLPMNDPAPDRT